jgi:hypothetical protein
MDTIRRYRTDNPIPRLQVGESIWIPGMPSRIACNANYWRTKLKRRFKITTEWQDEHTPQEQVGARVTRIL